MGKFQQMFEQPDQPTLQRASFAFAQVLDLLGDVGPIEFLEAAFAQGARLFLRPGVVVTLVKISGGSGADAILETFDILNR